MTASAKLDTAPLANRPVSSRAKIPVMLTSRADSAEARMASCALAQLYDAYCQNGQSVLNNERTR
jgi:hypothetical protein